MKALFVSLFLLSGLICCAQGKPFNGLTTEEIQNLISNNFSKMLTGQNTSAIGSYASVDIEKTSLSFSPSFMLSNKDIINGKLQGGATDGLSPLFKDNKLNTNISAEMQYNFMVPSKKNNVNYNKDILDTKLAKELNLRFDIYDLYMKFYTQYGPKNINIPLLVSSGIIAGHKKKDKTFLGTDEIEKMILEVDLNLKVINANINAQIPFDINNIIRQRYDHLIDIISEKEKKDKIENSEKLSLSGFNINWFTLGCKIRNDEFRLFDPNKPIGDQSNKEGFMSKEISIQFSRYNFSENDVTFYYSAAIAYRYKSNYQELLKKTITETSTIGASGQNTTESTESYIAYQGNYIPSIDEAGLLFDIYYFPKSFKSFGVHVFQSSKFTELQKPRFDLGFGAVLPFKNKKKEGKSIVNIEVYYNLKDLSKGTNNYDRSIADNNELGLRFTFPFNF